MTEIRKRFRALRNLVYFVSSFSTFSESESSQVESSGHKGREGKGRDDVQQQQQSSLCLFISRNSSSSNVALSHLLSFSFLKNSHTQTDNDNILSISRLVPTSRAHTHKHTVTQNMFPNDETAAQQEATRVSGYTSSTTKL